jgi:hypothetical protein
MINAAAQAAQVGFCLIPANPPEFIILEINNKTSQAGR